MNKIEVKANIKDIKEIKKVGVGGEKGEEMVVVKLGGEEQKNESMRKKRSLKGRRERITEDWTWKERKMR